MPRLSMPHRTKHSTFRGTSILLVLPALLAGAMTFAAAAAGAGHHAGGLPASLRDAHAPSARTAHGKPPPRRTKHRRKRAAKARTAKTSRVEGHVRRIVLGSSPTASRDNSPPTTPKRVTVARATTTSLTLSWTRSNDNVAVAGYDLYLAGRPTMQTAATTYTIALLACSATYNVGVAAYDAAGNRSRTAWISAATAACSSPPPPPPPPPPPGPPPPPPPPPPSGGCAAGQYQASYFNNLNLASPVALTRCESAPLNQHWGTGSPTGVNPDNISARYTGSFDFQATTYTFSYQHDDGIRVYVDGTLVVDKWAPLPACPCPNTGTFSRAMTAGSHAIRVEFEEFGGAADIALSWAPGSAPSPPPPPPPPPPTGEPPPIAGQGYTLRFDDQFTTLNRAVWDDHIWYQGAPAANAQYVQNGVFHLVSRRSQGYPETTATTLRSRSFTQGYFEARMRWTAGAGSWPAFWLISTGWANTGSCSTPAAEIDVFEGQGIEPTVFYGTVHQDSAGRCAGHRQNGNNWQPTTTNLTAGFHTYGAKWTADQVCWYLDDKPLHCAPTYPDTNQPMFLLLQMWIGGWTIGTNATTPDELHTEVDWVRVWQK